MGISGHGSSLRQGVARRLDTTEIRRATLLLVEDDEVRHNLTAGITGSIADRPDLARAIRSALDDPKVRTELRDALESAPLRAVIWKAADNQFRGRRWALIREAAILVVRHRHARRLALALRRHGVIRELRRPDRGEEPQHPPSPGKRRWIDGPGYR